MRTIAFILIIALLAGLITADVYLQGMIKGSNNRLHEASATRATNNRIFNSQNNARGGYNVGEETTTRADTGNADYATQSPATTYNIATQTTAQYADTYYEGSEVILAWTNQHGCGGNPLTDPHNMHCNIVIQYTCDTVHEDQALNVKLYNGLTTTQSSDGNLTPQNCKGSTINEDRGIHENECWYAECKTRRRNKGLFLADQTLNTDAATHTRQNAGGARSGLECEEEREYYPWWGPTPWRDVAYLTSELNATNIDPCKMVKDNTQNTNMRYKCRPTKAPAPATPDPIKAWQAITPEACVEAQGEWVGYSWNIPEPYCGQAPWSRDNHLGSSRDGHYTNYTWTIPQFDELFSGNGVTAAPSSATLAKCVVRIRYNITTADYDPWNTFSESNAANGVISPVTNNPRINVGGNTPVRLALNTAQTGRTFQDRTHVFTIRRRPAELENKRIVNLSIIGKRCNIVECYPAVEYLWMPSHPIVKVGDVLHVQWTGSNTHNNGANGGDGQTGDSGQGQGGTDRHNMVVTHSEAHNFPIPLDLFNDTLWDNVNCQRPTGPTGTLTTLSRNDCAITMATSGYYTSIALTNPTGAALSTTLDNAPPSLIGGVLLTPTAPGVFPFICSRDNNFTNRDQRGVITVTP